MVAPKTTSSYHKGSGVRSRRASCPSRARHGLTPQSATHDSGSPRHCERLRRLAPACNGSLGILRGHAPLMVLLGSGTLRIDCGREQKSFAVSGGFLHVVDNQVTVLSESASAA